MTTTSSLHEKTHADEEDVPPVEDVPDYDDLIESALDALDVYQARRADMNLHLKKAFFNLAQAKLALGPARVGPASYHHGRVEPLLTVDIVPTENGTYTYNLLESKPAIKPESQAPAKGKERATSSRVDLRYTGSTSSAKIIDTAGEKSEPSSVRRRVKNIFKKDKDTNGLSEKNMDTCDDRADMLDTKEDTRPQSANGASPEDGPDSGLEAYDAPPTYIETVNEYLLDPMQQFSAFPPVTLRKAQTEFRQSLRLATTLLSEQQKFGGMSTAASEVIRKA